MSSVCPSLPHRAFAACVPLSQQRTANSNEVAEGAQELPARRRELSPPCVLMPPKRRRRRRWQEESEAPGGKTVQQKNPAEFFAENQNIAGFDNPGKALYTTIRELVENSLDAAESIQVLPSIQVEVTELSQKSFDAFRGSEKCARQDLSLYHKDSQPEGDAAPHKEVDGVGITVGEKRKLTPTESFAQQEDLKDEVPATQDSLPPMSQDSLPPMSQDLLPPLSQDVGPSQSQSSMLAASAANSGKEKLARKQKEEGEA